MFPFLKQREMTASKSTTACSQKEFETLAFLEHLQSQLLWVLGFPVKGTREPRVLEIYCRLGCQTCLCPWLDPDWGSSWTRSRPVGSSGTNSVSGEGLWSLTTTTSQTVWVVVVGGQGVMAWGLTQLLLTPLLLTHVPIRDPCPDFSGTPCLTVITQSLCEPSEMDSRARSDPWTVCLTLLFWQRWLSWSPVMFKKTFMQSYAFDPTGSILFSVLFLSWARSSAGTSNCSSIAPLIQWSYTELHWLRRWLI